MHEIKLKSVCGREDVQEKISNQNNKQISR